VLPASEGTVELERRIAARAETIFSYLIDPEQFRRWQGVDAELDPRPGGIFRVRGTTHPHHIVSGQYVEVEPPTRLVYTWGYEPNDALAKGQRGMPPGSSTVEMVLVPDGDATIVRIRHSGLPTDDACQFHGLGWETVLEQLFIGAEKTRR